MGLSGRPRRNNDSFGFLIVKCTGRAEWKMHGHFGVVKERGHFFMNMKITSTKELCATYSTYTSFGLYCVSRDRQPLRGRTLLSSFSFAAPRCPKRSRRSSQAPRRRHRGRNGIGLLLQSGANRAPAGYGRRTSTTNNENGRNVSARGVRLYREPQTNDDRRRSPFKDAMHLSRVSDFTRAGEAPFGGIPR